MTESAEPAPYRVRARNTAADSTNKIHDDTVARSFGFAGGLVPGITAYAYLSHVPTALWGRPWLQRGVLEARFLRPVYDGDDIVIEPGPLEQTEEGEALQLTLRGPSGDACVGGRAMLPAHAATPPSLRDYPVAPLPAEPPAASPAVLAAIEQLGTVEVLFDPLRAERYLDSIGEGLDLYRRDGLAHPGWLLQWANWVLVANVALGPWVHTASTVRHYSSLEGNSTVSTRGRVADLYERRGNRMVELDLLLVAGSSTPLAHVRHTAIYDLRPRV
jgi:hypothetical protein